MSITLTSVKAAYLAKVAEGLADLSEEDREEVIQDLEAHLAELDDDEVVSNLGEPTVFVAEFRHSAGLTDPGQRPRFVGLRRARATIEQKSARFAELIQWDRFRPAWIWTRGWFLVTGWGLLYYTESFERFPIPRFGGSSLTGLVLALIATSISVWLEKGQPTSRRKAASDLFSFVAGVAVLASLFNPIYASTHQVMDDPALYVDRLTGADGEPVANIFAYDLEGNPVEVLLFDQGGRPLLSLPTYVYEDAEYNPGQVEVAHDFGAVTFRRDDFGRIIPNLYPLQLSAYDDYGELSPVPPPSLGFPTVDDGEEDGDPGTVSTTIVRNQ